MLTRTLFAFLLCALTIGSLPAQDDVLEVRPNALNVAAQSLVGTWERNEQLCERLGKNGADVGYEFQDDASVLTKIEPKLRRELADHHIYLAGWMIKHTSTGKSKRAYMLTEYAGNSMVFWFRERKGHPMGDAESFNVSVIRANDRRKDLLFIGGGERNQSFEAFSRKQAPVGKFTPHAAIADMMRLVQADKMNTFVNKYCSPNRLKELQDRNLTVDDIAGRLRKASDRLVKSLTAASKAEPTLSDKGNKASWEFDGETKDIHLERIDGRWYLADR